MAAATVVLVSLGVLGVHEARYAWGESEVARMLAEPGHGYLELAPLAVAVLVVVATLEFLGALRRTRTRTPRSGRDGPPPSFGALWPRIAAALVLAHLAQEAAEHLVAAHEHLSLGAHLVGGGAWFAVAASVVLGAAIAFGLCGAQAVLRAAARGHRPPPRACAPSRLRGPRTPHRPRAGVLALRLAGAPPWPAR